MLVTVEVLAFQNTEKGTLKWRRTEGIIYKDEKPDEAALRAALSELKADEFNGLCHSTSWRFSEQEGGGIVLTYAILPDPHAEGDAEAQDLCGTVVSACIDPLRPAPPNIQADQVAAHAIMHLAELSRRDPTVQAQVRNRPELWDAVRSFAEGVRTTNATG